MDIRKRRIFILGAGASYAVGLPDAHRSIGHLFLYVRGPYPRIRNRTPTGLFGDLGDALIYHSQKAGFKSGDRFPFDSVAEAFHQWVEYHAPGSLERSASHELLRLFFLAIREYMYVRSCDCANGYATFADSLRPGDIVITLNWDLCLEIALFLKSKSARVSFLPVRDSTITIIKPHGSVDLCAAEIPDVQARGARYLELIHDLLPSEFATEPTFAPQLLRLRTYDCPYEIQMSWDGPTREISMNIEERKKPFQPEESDIGPLHLDKLIRGASFFLLTPGAHRQLYEWSYSRLLDIVREIAAEVSEVIVCGYSFPDYDYALIDVLADAMKTIGSVPAHIVNPAARHLSEAKLKKIFGKYELHQQGFSDFNWSAL